MQSHVNNLPPHMFNTSKTCYVTHTLHYTHVFWHVVYDTSDWKKFPYCIQLQFISFKHSFFFFCFKHKNKLQMVVNLIQYSTLSSNGLHLFVFSFNSCTLLKLLRWLNKGTVDFQLRHVNQSLNTFIYCLNYLLWISTSGSLTKLPETLLILPDTRFVFSH